MINCTFLTLSLWWVAYVYCEPWQGDVWQDSLAVSYLYHFICAVPAGVAIGTVDMAVGWYIKRCCSAIMLLNNISVMQCKIDKSPLLANMIVTTFWCNFRITMALHLISIKCPGAHLTVRKLMMIKSKSFDKNFPTWLMINQQHINQSIRSHVKNHY